MNRQRALDVIVMADQEETRAMYVETLCAMGCVVRTLESSDDVAALAAEARMDVVVLDIGLHASAFAVAERLAPLRNRPRLIAVTEEAPTGTSLERLFDGFVVKPCLPDDLVDAIDLALEGKIPEQDLLIIARGRSGVPAAVQHFGDIGARVEIRVDERHGERRRPAHGGSSAERRRRDRRTRDVSDRLRVAGWALVPGAERS